MSCIHTASTSTPHPHPQVRRRQQFENRQDEKKRRKKEMYIKRARYGKMTLLGRHLLTNGGIACMPTLHP